MAHTAAQRHQNTPRPCAGTSSRNGSRGHGIKNGAASLEKEGNYYIHELRHYLVRYIGTLFRPFSSSVKLIIHYLPIETRPLFQLT